MSVTFPKLQCSEIKYARLSDEKARSLDDSCSRQAASTYQAVEPSHGRASIEARYLPFCLDAEAQVLLILHNANLHTYRRHACEAEPISAR